MTLFAPGYSPIWSNLLALSSLVETLILIKHGNLICDEVTQMCNSSAWDALRNVTMGEMASHTSQVNHK